MADESGSPRIHPWEDVTVWNAVSPLQKCDDTKPGKPGIEYADVSWNPYTGCRNIENGNCNLGPDCWAYSMAVSYTHLRAHET